jgi:putative ABC transport system substrate-binding protein
MKRIGVLMPYAENDPETSSRVTALREALLKLGWTEGRNIRFEHRWPASDPEAISKLAREIVDMPRA